MSDKKLADALRECKARLDLLIKADRHKLLDVVAVNKAREALAAYDADEHQEGLMIIGNPVDGFRFVGPFACESDGVNWAMEHAPHDVWTTGTMENPQA